MTTTETPTISRRATRTGLPQLGHYLSEAYRYRTFALYWSKADIKARNFETFLGRLWHFLNPLLFGLIYFVLVGILSGGGGEVSGAERLAFIVGNLYVWTFFAAIVTTGAGSVQGGAGGVLAQSAIPRVVLPFASALTAGNLFIRSLVAYVPIHLFAGRGLHWEMLWMPLLLVITGIFGFGLALLFAVANVYFRDVSRLLPHFMRLWLYMSPVIWVYTRAVDGGGLMETLARLNPMFSGMTAWTIAFGGQVGTGGPTIVSSLLVFSGWAAALLLIGFFTFISREDEFAIRN
ncbi:MAG TPA: ABC transporter permease [Acidimicrobiia bacterium]|nr:ABC transporter permease [Acidimicrobiia bacterium]